jgi:hypothetical protein
MTRGWLPVLGVAIACACGPIDESKSGNLGNGTFAYGCISGNDPFCPSSSFVLSPDNPFPTQIALNAAFTLTYFPNDCLNCPSYPTVEVLAVSPDFIGTEEGPPLQYTALRPGTPWFYVQVPGQQILDITSINVEEIAGIRVTNTAGVTAQSFTETVGSTDTFSAQALDSSSLSLAGDVVYAWSSTDPSVLTVADGSRTVSATFASPGTTTVTVSAQGVQTAFTVTVSP